MSINLPQRRLVSQDEAAMIESPQVPRSRFTGSWSRKTTFDAGELIPFMVDEVLPGDHLTYDVTAYVRMATPLFPLFDNQRIDTFFFFVPNRLLWDNWQEFMGEQANPGDSIAFTVPQIVSPAGGFSINSIYDHMGIPCVGQLTAGETITINALPFRAYKLIYKEWFRDQNLQTISVQPQTGNGPDAEGLYAIVRRGKAHDYFTSALPWPQKFSNPNVPIAGLAPVIGFGKLTQNYSGANVTVFESDQTSAVYQFAGPVNWGAAGQHGEYYVQGTGAATGHPSVFADLSQATGVTVNQLRLAFLTQALLERDARGGTRYVEIIRSHFGVTSPDFRLQRPEYIGGGQSPLQLTPVAQTAPTTGVPLGALGAAGTSVGQHRASYAATEHGYILGLINVRSELSYQQGTPRLFNRLTRYDFYWPALAGLGEQTILRKEIYTTGVNAEDDAVFGYQERWHEYRTRYSEVTGMFRSTHAGTIDQWHLAQRFNPAPTLNAAFIVDDPPMTRVLAAAALANEQQYLADILIRRDAVRPIPMYGTPVSFGRF